MRAITRECVATFAQESEPPMKHAVMLLSILSAISTDLIGCKSGEGQALSPPGVRLSALTVTSPVFVEGQAMPVDFTCDGADHAPPLTLSAPPPDTRSLAIVMDDPDAPGGTFTHWIAYNLRPDTSTLAEGADLAALGGLSGTNDFKRLGYGGPCPPRFEEHHYRFRVLALDTLIHPEPPATRDAIDAAVKGHLVGEGTLVGIYSH
jgi:Raf kinase inhibitor-like YbhB/YbcL family protein